MYSNHFGLRCRPFEDWVDTQFFYATADCEETLAAMEYESQHGRGISLLLGEAGTGKTLLIRTLLHRLDTSDHVAVLAWLPGEQVDLVRETAKGFGVSLPPSHHNARCVARLRRHLTYTRKANHRSVLIIDQAENLTPEAMTQLAALTDLQHDGERLLNIALVGQPHVRSVLDDPQFAQISQQLYGEHILRPLTLPEAERYVQHRLRIAGAGDVSLFDQEAVALIHEASNGIPRLINHMCDAAMLAACSAGESRINSDIAAEVARKGGSEERCANASELGVTTAEQVAIGLPYEASSHVPADHAVTGSTRANQPSTAVVEERVDDWYRSDGRKQDAVVALPEPTLARGEMLLERLERVLARADRMNATSEASLAQFTAVEKHLTALTDGAERLIGSLAETVEKTNESVDGLQRRLDDALGQAETRTQTIEAQLSLASDLSTDAEDQARCIEVACGHADQVESGLTSFAEQLADRADEVQKRMTLLLTGLQTSEEVQSKLDGTLQQASSTTATVEEKVNALRTALDETKTEAERFQKKFTDVTLVDCQQKLQEQLEAHLRTQQETMDATVTAHRARLQELIDESASQMRAFDHAIAAGRQKIDETLADAECSRTELCDAIRHESDQLTQQVEILERRQGSMASPVSAISDELEAAGTKVRDLTGTVRNVESSVEQLTQRASAAEMSLSPVVQQAEKLLPDMSGVCGQVEALQRSVSTTLLDIGGACERAGAVRDQAVQCEQIVVRLASGRAEGEKTAKQLEEVVASARQPLQDMQRTVVDATEKSGRLGSQNASAAKVLERLSEANVTGQTLIEQAGESTRAAEEMAETVKEQITQLTSLRSACENGTEELGELVTSANQLHEAMQGTVAHADEKSGQLDSRNASAAKVLEQLSETNVAGQTLIEQAGESTRAAEEAAETVKEQLTQLTSLRSACEDDTEELRELVTSANQLHEAMQGAVAHTDEKIGQLDSHNAAAINVLRNLAEANAEGHTIIERVNESTQSVEQAADNASERVDRLVQDVWALTARTEVNAKELTAYNDRAGNLIDKLDATTTPAEKITAKLAQHVEVAKQYATTLAEGCSQAGEFAERVSAIANLLQTARETEEAVKTTTEGARTARDELTATANDAAQQRDRLQTLNASTEDLIETRERTKQDAQTENERLTAQLSATQQSIEASGPLLDDFISQAQALEQRLRDLQGKTAQIERTLSETTARPTEIMETAQAQAAQLEKVCAVVRKVFGNLSQTSLEARKHTGDCKQASQEASKQLAMLTAETDRAAATLHEWIEEAVRAQSRLEKTLQQCPSIRETHPADTLTRMSRAVRPAGRIVNTGIRGEFDMLSDPGVTERTPNKEEPTRPPTRSEEVARLIEDAKRAAVGTRR